MGRNWLLFLMGCAIVIFSSFIVVNRDILFNNNRTSDKGLVEEFKNKFNLDRNIEVVFVGDVMLGRNVLQTALDKKKDFTYPFQKVQSTLVAADMALANLENPVIKDCPRFDSGFTFCTDPEMLFGLTYAGIDAVNLANNHTRNFGVKGFDETKGFLSEKSIGYAGDGNLWTEDIRGVKFGYIGFDKSQQNNPKLTELEEKLVKDSDSQVDVLIVAMHWGVEYQDVALPGVKALAKHLVDLGADVIHGHHPHWVQDFEYINGKPVYYSLGNFVFDQMWSEETKKGLIVKLTLDSKGNFVKDEKIPTYIEEIGQPRLAN